MDKTILKRVALSVVLGTIGLVYGIMMPFIGAALMGAGHGTAFYFYLFAAMEPIGRFLWIGLGILLPWRSLWLPRFAASALLLLNLFPVCLALTNDGAIGGVLKSLQLAPIIAVPVLAAYLVVVVVIIFVLVYNGKNIASE